MPEFIIDLTILVTALSCGLMAGVFFIFSNTVMDSLAELPLPDGVSAMQAINRTIQNPLFFVVFLGPALTSLFLIVSVLWRWNQTSSMLMLAGGLTYLIGTIAVTIVFNVPMNNALDAQAAESSAAATLWTRYLSRWTNWNHVRTLASLAATVFFTLSLMM